MSETRGHFLLRGVGVTSGRETLAGVLEENMKLLTAASDAVPKCNTRFYYWEVRIRKQAEFVWRAVHSNLGLVVLLFPYRTIRALSWVGRSCKVALIWLFTSREHTNLTYQLEPRNERHMAHWVANLTGVSSDRVLELFLEIERDSEFNRLVRTQRVKSPKRFTSDEQVRLGRRKAWYALVRILRPALIVETGTDKGLGALVLARAAQLNQFGNVLTIDANPRAGEFIRGNAVPRLRMEINDSVDEIRNLAENEVDFFIHDSLHTYSHETAELRALESKLAPEAWVLSDNSEETDALIDWSMQAERVFHYFQEKPMNCPYHGGGVGVSI